MNRSSYLIGCLMFLCSLFLSAEKPNIIYILADDMGYADAGFNGGTEIKTPHLDQLAAGGSILKSYYVQPVCSPTRSALMTGRYPSSTGIYSVIKPHSKWGLKLEEQTLAQGLRDAGYETAISGKWHLGEFEEAYRPTKRGFDQQYGLWFGAIDYFTHERDGFLDWHRNDQPCKDEGYSTHLLAKEACRMIRDKNPEKPLFLYLPFNAVHGPLQVPESYMAAYPNLKGDRLKYAGMLSAMDEAIGQVVAALNEKGIRNDTLIIFSSDNGGPNPGQVTSNGSLRAGKATLYEGGVRVCSFVNWPEKVPAGKIINEPLHAVDWYPTLLKLVGAKVEQKLPVDGKDIWPVITKDAKSPHEVIILNAMVRGHMAIRKGDWKLIVGANGSDDDKQLYDLSKDIGERNNLAAENSEKLKELLAVYDEVMKSAAPPGEPKDDATGRNKRGVK